jgi:hypothetical protein
VSRKALALSTLLLAHAVSGNAAVAEHDVPAVRVFVAGSGEALLRTRAALRELFARMHADAIVEPADGEAVLGAAASDDAPRAFLDFRSPGPPRVVLVQRPSGKELERRTLPSSASLEVSVEEAAHVVYMAVESSLHGGDPDAVEATPSDAPSATAPEAAPTPAPTPAATSAPAPAPAPAATPAPAPATPAVPVVVVEQPAVQRDSGVAGPGTPLPLSAGVSVFGAVTSFAASHPLGGVGVALDGALGSGRVRPAALLSLDAFFPAQASNGRDDSLGAQSARLDAMVEWLATSRLVLAAGAGGGADRITFDAAPSTASLQASGAETRVDPVFEALLAARFRITGGLGVFALIAADVDLKPHRYVMQTDSDVTTVLALPRARPVGFLGLTYAFAEHATQGRAQ